MKKKYILKASPDEKIVNKLIEQGLEPVLAPLYVSREITDISAYGIEPFTKMLNIKHACEILYEHIINNKKICIVADYDADGATSCVIGLEGLRMLGANVDYMVPNRFIHGYGLTPSVVQEVKEKQNPDLIVTVDNGVASLDGVIKANELGMKVLVTDHHLQGEILPPAECIVNPNQKACSFPSKNIAGCGVIFYVISALSQYMMYKGMYTKETIPSINNLLDLVAIGTVADVVKLDKNNRLLVKLGLKMIQQGKTRPGILALIDVSGRNKENLSTTDIGFCIGPRINAAGRLEDMSIGISCLLEKDPSIAKEKAIKLDSINKERKQIGYDMNDVSIELMKTDSSNFSKVVYDASFHEGVIGIVASKIKEQFYQPTIVFANSLEEEDIIKGSGRSIPEIHLRDAIDYVHKKDSSIIVKFGGHAMAAGVTIHKNKLEDFKKYFEESVSFFADGKIFDNVKEIDGFLNDKDINIKNVNILNSELWGQGFLAPLFASEFYIQDQIILKEKHLKLKGIIGKKTVEAIWFFQDKYIEQEKVNLVYTLSINKFRDQTNVQLMVEGVYDLE